MCFFWLRGLSSNGTENLHKARGAYLASAHFLANGGTLENAQAMADHASPRTTQLYDRTGDENHARRGRADCDLKRGPEMGSALGFAPTVGG